MEETGDARVACTLTSTLLKRVRSMLGDEGVRQVVRGSGVTQTPDYLEQPDNWIPYDSAVLLFETAVEVTGDEQIGRHVGQDAVRQHAGTGVATLLRSLGSPERIYEQIALTATKFSTVTELTPVEVEPGQAILKARNRLGIPRHPLLCDYTRGMLSQPPVLFGLPAAAVEESTCAARGDDVCLYTVTWDAEAAAAAAEPQALITALEAQVQAMHDRLENMYATASDLISLDDVDGALVRITERAASAVRAPTYLLAVRTGEKLHVHSRGLASEDADRLAQELLDGDGSDDWDSRLIAEVASSRRRYGRIMAASPAGGFFPSERELFGVYGRYAAAVLDSAMALEEAHSQHDQSRALLELSQAFASATTRDEVAQRLSEAIPSMVDCDRVAVYLMDEEEEDVLTCRAATGALADDPLLRELKIHPTDSPLLRRPAENERASKPRYVNYETADPFVRSVMETLGSRAVVGVPMSVRGTFHGMLIIAAIDRLERLEEGAELSELLSGVVAHAVTAFENARLLETLAHRALHDGLTGLLGHRAFHEALEGSVSFGKADSPVTLAMVDIDDFKAINDEYGHPVGDEALRLVSDELRRAVRDNDTVFRVGGEEFAVLFRGVNVTQALPIAERLRAAVERIDFGVPLRVSVGLASWPDQAADRDGLLRTADAALYDSKRGGKNRTTAAVV